MLINSRQKEEEERSFVPEFIGPFIVIRIINDVNYQVKEIAMGKAQVVQYNRMIKYQERKEYNLLLENEQVLEKDEWLKNKMKIAMLIARKRGTLINEDSNSINRLEKRNGETNVDRETRSISQE